MKAKADKPATRLFAPMLDPSRYPIPVGHQYDLFRESPRRSAEYGGYKPAQYQQHLPISNLIGGPFIPPTVIQMERARRYIEKQTTGGTCLRRQSFYAMHLFIHGLARCDVMLRSRQGLLQLLARRAWQLARERTSPREIRRRLRSEKLLATLAPSVGLSACQQHCNGF